MSAFYRHEGARVLIEVHAQPGAARTEVAGLHDGRLRVRIAAPARDRRANDALIAFLAERLGVARRNVVITAGMGARRKRVAVSGAPRAPETLLEGG